MIGFDATCRSAMLQSAQRECQSKILNGSSARGAPYRQPVYGAPIRRFVHATRRGGCGHIATPPDAAIGWQIRAVAAFG
jgi:hypothetical protein